LFLGLLLLWQVAPLVHGLIWFMNRLG